MHKTLWRDNLSYLQDQVRLFGISKELDEIILDFAYLAYRFKDFHPGNNGDISQVLSEDLGDYFKLRYKKTASNWYPISEIHNLAEVRNDGRKGYKSEGISDPKYYKYLLPMAGRVMMVTYTGSEIPSLKSTIEQGEEGKLLNFVEVDKTATKIRLLYGNVEFGTIPSIETHIHLVSNAMSIDEGVSNPATVHAHPFHIITLGRDKKIRADFIKFNAALYAQNGAMKNMHGHLMGVVEYSPSGSQKLALLSLDLLKKHHMTIWMNHGVTIRSETIRKGYILMSYADDAARTALDSLRFGSMVVPESAIGPFMKEKGLLNAYKELFAEQLKENI